MAYETVSQEQKAIVLQERAELARANVLDAFAAFLRLNVAQAEVHCWWCCGEG